MNLQAAKVLKGKAKFMICGDIDKEAKDSISLDSLNYWIKNSIIEYIGFMRRYAQYNFNGIYRSSTFPTEKVFQKYYAKQHHVANQL